jgi:hypothetical protein
MLESSSGKNERPADADTPTLDPKPSTVFQVDNLNKRVWDARLTALEKQAIADLQQAIRLHGRPVLTTALIASDQVILHILHKAGLLKEVQARNHHLRPLIRSHQHQCQDHSCTHTQDGLGVLICFSRMAGDDD